MADLVGTCCRLASVVLLHVSASYPFLNENFAGIGQARDDGFSKRGASKELRLSCDQNKHHALATLFGENVAVHRRAAIDEIFHYHAVFHDPELDSAANNTSVRTRRERHFALVEGLRFPTAGSTTAVGVWHNKRCELQMYLGFETSPPAWPSTNNGGNALA